jgi:inosine/xanthosine triphosphatase
VRLAVGSTRAPKLDAVRRAAAILAGHGLPEAQIVAVDVSDVAPLMPLSGSSLRAGSRVRAHRALELLRDRGEPARFGIGLEGGLDVVSDEAGDRRAFLMSWACVSDGARDSFGAGGALQIPERLAAAVIDEGVELGDAMARFSGEHDVRSGQGAWGVLTAGVVDRARSFEIALLNAFAPFYNPSRYR